MLACFYAASAYTAAAASAVTLDRVMDLCTGGDLASAVVQRGTFSERDAAVALKDMIRVVSELGPHFVTGSCAG